MSYFFSSAIKTLLTSTPNALHAIPVRVILFRTAPSMSSDSPSDWLQSDTLVELLTYPGWEEVSGISGYPMPNLVLSIRPGASEVPWDPLTDPPAFQNNYYYTFSDYVFDIDEPISIGAIGFERVSDEMLILVTNTPTGMSMNIGPGDRLLAGVDTENFPPAEGPATKRWLFSWVKNPVQVNPIENTSLVVLKQPPTFEISNTLHAWLYPQRANMIVNPSFEAGSDFWEPMPEQVEDAAPGGGKWAGKWMGGPPLAIESNIWPTLMGNEQAELWTIQLMAKCDAGMDVCHLKVALVSWDADYRITFVDWGTETWTLMSEAWIHVVCTRQSPQAHQAMLRLEATGMDITIDKVLVERGALKEWPYFDGDEFYSSPGAYSWYGGESKRHISYSLWYGGRRSVMGRVFATPTDTDAPEDIVTDRDVLASGMVNRWVPAGVTVVPHIDVFYPGDLRSSPPARTKPLLPYYDEEDNPMGIQPPPWKAEELPQGDTTYPIQMNWYEYG